MIKVISNDHADGSHDTSLHFHAKCINMINTINVFFTATSIANWPITLNLLSSNQYFCIFVYFFPGLIQFNKYTQLY